MVGCKCTYINCTVRSWDGSDWKTHMFRYPVFDKVRCLKWIRNAQRHEFLSLTVSQLKNRVICENHFKDDNFMNYKKDKLNCQAVPTEAGPFCDLRQWDKYNKNSVLSFPIITEEIENEDLIQCEKKANLSVKYVDFLTKCDELLNNTNLHRTSFNNKNNISAGAERYSKKLTFQSDSNINVNNSAKKELADVNPYDINCFQTDKDIELLEIKIEDNV